MRIFNKSHGWTEKVNFVDENNVVLGYDLAQSCWEQADWFISDTPTEKCLDRSETSNGTPEELPGWVFDPSFFRTVETDEFESGGMAIFRIVKDGAEKFVHIFNSHNGYYCHGFDFKAGEAIIQEGSL